MRYLGFFIKQVVLIGGVLFTAQTIAAKVDHLLVMNTDRAKFNYQMFCQGCHTPDGVGGKSVPKIKNFIGYFLQKQVAREYLVRVPGSANSSLNNEQLAEVLNWMILEFGGKSIPKNMHYYTSDEVGKLRLKPLFEVVEYRKKLVEQLLVK